MKIKEGKVYRFKSSSPVREVFWGRKAKIVKTGCDFMFGATIRAKLIDNGMKMNCYENDFLPIKNNIIKI